MKPFKHFLERVGYDADAKAPEAKYAYYGYKEGEARQFNSMQDAQLWSKYTERVQLNKAEVHMFWKERQDKEVEATIMWNSALRDCFSHLSPEVYGICYDEAYERGHAYGYDEVASCMNDVVEFAERILEATK